MQHATQDGVDLRHYLRFIWRRKISIALTAIVAVLLGLAYTRFQSVQYTSTAEVLLRPRASEVVIDSAGSQADARNATSTEVQVVQSATVSNAVAERLGFPATVVVTQIGDTDVITISATRRKPEVAQNIAQTWADTYIEVRKQKLIADLKASADQLQKQITEIDAQIASLQGAIDALTSQIAVATGDEKLALTAQRDVLSRQSAGQITALTERKANYTDELELRKVAEATTSGGAQIISDAAAAAKESGRTPVKNGLLGLAAGLVLGLGIAFIREQLDDRIRDKDDFDSFASRAPLLGVIPVGRGRSNDRKAPGLVTKLTSDASAATEAYNGLRASLQFALAEHDMKMFQVTSAGRHDGKSTVAANIATAFAQTGLRVVLADCDFREPRLHAMFDVANDVGLSAVLKGEAPITDAARPIAEEPDLLLLVAGAVPPNPSELVSTDRARRLLSGIRRDAEITILDSPSLPVADSVALAARSDGVLLVVRAGHTSRRSLSDAIDLLDQVNATIIGTVLTDERRSSLRGDDYDVYGAPTGLRRLFFWRTRRAPKRQRASGGLMSSVAPKTGEVGPDGDAARANGQTTDPVRLEH